MSPNSFVGTTELTRALCPSWGGQLAAVQVPLGSHMHWLHGRSLLSMLQGTLSMLQVSRDVLYERWKDSKGQISTVAILAQLYDCRLIEKKVCM